MLHDRAAFGVRNLAVSPGAAVAVSERPTAPLLAALDPSADTVWWSEGGGAEAVVALGDLPVQLLFLRFPVGFTWFGPTDEAVLSFHTEADGPAIQTHSAPIVPDAYTGSFALWLPEPVVAPFARVRVASSVVTAIATDHLWLGPVFQPRFNWQPGARPGGRSLSSVEETLSGSTLVVRRRRLRERSAAWSVVPGLHADDLIAWRDLRDRLDTADPFVWCRSPIRGQDETYLARFTTPPEPIEQQAGEYVVTAALREFR